MTAKGLNQASLARKISTKKATISQQAIQHLASGRSNTSKWLPEIARGLDTTIEYLMTGSSSEQKLEQESTSDSELMRQANELRKDVDSYLKVNGIRFALLPTYNIDASAGHGSLIHDEAPSGYHTLPDEWLRTITRAPVTQLAMVRVVGDSMWNTLHHGDYVLVDRTKTSLARAGIYVLQFEGELLVKRVEKRLDTGDVQVISDNTQYPAQTIKETDNLNLMVVGRVVWMSRALG